jgi:hypothetical protein
MDFWPESPASGVKKRISGFFRASGNQKSTFLHPRAVPPSGRVPCPLFYVQNAPYDKTTGRVGCPECLMSEAKTLTQALALAKYINISYKYKPPFNIFPLFISGPPPLALLEICDN